MNKKGFTLIELLAVIIVLAIISLIAIPTVNNIVKNAKEEGRNRTLTQIKNSAEDECSRQKLKGDNIVHNYTITNGQLDNKLDIKGQLPDSGTIYLDDNCNATVAATFEGKEILIGEPPLEKQTLGKYTCGSGNSTWSCALQEKYTDIDIINNTVSISFVRNTNVPNNAVHVWQDVSIKGGNNYEGDGNIKAWIVPNATNNTKYDLYYGSNSLIYGNSNSSYLFYGFQNLKSVNFDNFSTKYIQNYVGLFNNCPAITSLDLSSFDTSNATTLVGLFANDPLLTSVNIKNFDTSNVTSMASMFYNTALSSIDISNFDTSKVTSMSGMFAKNSNLQTIDMRKFNTENVIYMTNMFTGCPKLKTLKLSTLNASNVNEAYFDTSKVTDMAGMFYNDTNLQTLDISSFRTPNVTTFEMFLGGTTNYSGTYDLSKFDFSKTTTMSSMFGNAKNVKEIKLGNSSTPNLTNVTNLFYHNEQITSLDLSHFDMRKVTKFSTMFLTTPKLETIIYDPSLWKTAPTATNYGACGTSTTNGSCTFVPVN